MNKKLITLGTIGLVIASLFSISQYISMKANYDDLEKSLATSKREISELNSMLTVNNTAVENNEEILEKHLQNYETLLRNLTHPSISDYHRVTVIKHAYDIHATVHTNSASFPLPKNGIVNVDSDDIELEITFDPPPELRDKDLNNMIHQYNTLLSDITFDSYNSNIEHFQDENTLRVTFKDLQYDHKNYVFIRNNLNTLLGLFNTEVVITRTDSHLKTEDYLPKNLTAKEFTADGTIYEYVHDYEYLTDDSWILSANDPVFKYEYNSADKVKFTFDNDLKVTEVSHDGTHFVPYEEMVLPQNMQLGYTWNFFKNTATITAIHHPLDTRIGTLNTVEITYKDEEDNFLYRAYYAENLGLVYRDFGGGGYSLKNIEYK